METLETRLNEVARIVVRLEQQTDCPAQLLIARWAIESKWGEKPVGPHSSGGADWTDPCWSRSLTSARLRSLATTSPKAARYQ